MNSTCYPERVLSSEGIIDTIYQLSFDSGHLFGGEERLFKAWAFIQEARANFQSKGADHDEVT